MGFTKLDSGIVDSSIWSAPLATRVVWVTMLAKADHTGFVGASRSGLLRAANVTEAELDTALFYLESPDPDSRNRDHDGRRIERVNGGWVLLNHARYRSHTYSDSPEASRKRRYRSAQSEQEEDGTLRDMSHDVPTCPTNVRDISASASASESSTRHNTRGYKGDDGQSPWIDVPCPERWLNTPVEPAWIAYLTMRRQIGQPVHNHQVAEVLERHLLTLSGGSIPAIVATLDAATLGEKTSLPTYVAGNIAEAARKAGTTQESTAAQVRRIMAANGLQTPVRAQ